MNALTDISTIRWLIDNWWVTLIRGIAAIIFGAISFYSPLAAVLTIAILWGAFALVDGILAIITAFRANNADTSSRWWMGLAGVVGVLAGVLTFFYPLGTSLGLLIFFASWLIIGGVLQIIGAIRLRAVIDNEWTLGLIGVLSVILGLSLIFFPGAGLISSGWMIGAFAIVAGVSYIALAMRLKKLADLHASR